MRRILTAIILTALFFGSALYAEDVPRPSGWVNDLAGVISAEDRDNITSIITELEQKTGAEIFVLTI